MSRLFTILVAFVAAILVLQMSAVSVGLVAGGSVLPAGNAPPAPNAPLTASFTFAPIKPVTAESVTFSGSASGGTPPYTFGWTFGDGATGAGPVVNHAYSTASTFTVTLTVTDSKTPPPANTTTVQNSIVVAAPLTADFTFSPTNPIVGQTVTFSGSRTGGHTPFTFAWEFGDGTTGAGQNTGHAFLSAATFTVTLTVTDSGGPPAHVATRSRPVTVVPPVVAGFTFSPTNPVVGQAVAFSGTATGGTPPYTFGWAFGDGGTATGPSVSHPYASAATFTVTLTATDSASRIDTESKFITVTGVLNVDFTFSPPNPSVNQAVTFTGTATGGTPPYTFSWAFGDGTTGMGPTVNHAYATSGNFTVTLTVTDSASHVASRSKLIAVSPGLTADFTISPPNPVVSQLVTFSATASGGSPPYTYTWTFGDGTPMGTGQTVTHTYTAAQTYTVNLRVTDSASRFVNVPKPLTVTTGLGASFTFSPAKPAVGDVVTFNGSAVGGAPPYTFGWSFGDGETGGGQIVGHVYGFPGTFTVILTVTDSAARTATTSRQVAVTAALDGDIHVSQPKPMVGEVVNFTAAAAGGTPPYAFTWIFGDGGTATGRNATHAYQTAGTFLVTLRVTDSVGHIHNSTLQLPVTPRLTANFTYTPVDPVANEEVFFNATVTGGTGPYEYLWAWGDGTPNGIGFGPAHRFATAGPFRVVLTVFDSANHRTNVTKTVTVNPALATGMTISQLHPAVGERVAFTANASGGSPPYTFRWDFGDATNATGVSVFHAYATDGTFDVEVTATDASGHRGIRVRPLVVTPRLTVDFNAPRNASAGERVNFAAEVDGGTAPYQVTWAFGDGITRVGPIANHTYGVAGTYNVTLAASDSANHTATVSKLVVVGGPLAARATFSPPTPLVGKPITFIGNASGGTPPYAYRWSFGDGTQGIGLTVTHFYVNATRFDVTLNITDALGRFSLARLVVVVNPNLTVTFQFDPSMPVPGRAITFTPIVSGGIPPYSYSWALGDPDGTTSSDEQPTHTYFSSDLFVTYRVILTVCDSAGNCETAGRDVTLVDWIQVATIAVSAGIASVLVIWFVRRFQGQRRRVLKAAGKTAYSAGRTAVKEATRLTRGVAGKVRDLRNGRVR